MTQQQGNDSRIIRPAAPEGAVMDAQLPNPSRRRLGKAGIAASGVVLTLGSRSAMAACSGNDKTPRSPSAFASCNNSRGGGAGGEVSTGGSPGYWSNQNGQATWETIKSVVPKNSLFQHHFDCGKASIYWGKELRAFLPNSGVVVNDPHNLARHFVAALLNCTMHWTDPYLTKAKLLQMYSEWNRTGMFRPGATAEPWLAPQIVAYLESTQGRN